jgi:hypothetical protein
MDENKLFKLGIGQKLMIREPVGLNAIKIALRAWLSKCKKYKITFFTEFGCSFYFGKPNFKVSATCNLQQPVFVDVIY